MDLLERSYLLSRKFPWEDRRVLGHQIRESCVSIPSNIAEGFGRFHTAEYIHHLRFSNGSNNELQTQIEAARRLKLVEAAEADDIVGSAEEVGRMLHGLIAALKRSR